MNILIRFDLLEENLFLCPKGSKLYCGNFQCTIFNVNIVIGGGIMIDVVT